jgi:hypothetical protein
LSVTNFREILNCKPFSGSTPEKMNPEPVKEIAEHFLLSLYPENHNGEMHRAEHFLPFLDKFHLPARSFDSPVGLFP